MSVVVKRTIIGVGLLAVLAGLLYLDFWVENAHALDKFSHGLPFTILVLCIANLTIIEIAKLIRKRGIKVNLSFLLISVSIMILCGFYIGQSSQNADSSMFSINSISQEDFQNIKPETQKMMLEASIFRPIPKYLLMLLGISFLYSFFIIVKTLFGSGEYNERMMTIVFSVFTFVLVGMPYTISLFVRVIPFFGLKLIIFIILVSRLGDSGAFFVGKAIGKIKAIPQISPKKTVEGCLGGLVTSIVVGISLSLLFDLELIFHMNNFITGAVLGCIVGITAQIADLLSSLIKRWAEVKDSGNLIPEFGGILDLTDNFILTVPVLYICILIVWV